MLSHLIKAREQLAGRWIIDFWATSHICNDQDPFVKLQPLKSLLDVVLGDGHKLTATAKGTVRLMIKCGQRSSRMYTLFDVLLIPELSYNLFSVSKAVERGNTVRFGVCILRDPNH